MLSFADEIFLLSLDDVDGTVSLSGGLPMLHLSLVGAALCELSFLGRIDTDQEFLYPVSAEKVNDPVLDMVIDIINARGSRETINFWIVNLLGEAKNIRKHVQRQLVAQGILKEVEERIFWVFPSRRYPVIDNEEVEDVERRLKDIILNPQAIPAPRDAVLIGLAYACGIFQEIFSPKEYRRLQDRISKLAKLDSIVRETAVMINELSIMNVDSLRATPI